MPHCDTLLHAGILVTQNDSRDVLANHSIAIQDGTIRALGPTGDMSKAWSAEMELNLGANLVMPGLINAHTHAAMTFLRGVADDLPLLEWLQKKVFPVEARLTPEIVRLGSLLGHAEMLATGTTACVDMYIFEDAVFEAAETSGIRCMGGEATFSFPSAACATPDEALERTRALAERHAASHRLKVAVNPHSVYTTNPEILSACRNLAQELDLPLHIHLAESSAETAASLDMHSMRPVAWCEHNGLFDCRLIAAHLVDLTAGEIASLARHGVRGAHNPSSNMKLASGIAPVPQMLAAGISLGIGTDGPASNNNLNMFAEMNRAALLHKLASADPTALPAGQILDMTTLAGARIFNDAQLGSLAPGMSADCIALDLTSPNLQPMHNPVAQIVYAASGHECVMTMVEGEVLYSHGKFSRFDYPALLAEVNMLRDFVLNRI